jgi:hypothetical protein
VATLTRTANVSFQATTDATAPPVKGLGKKQDKWFPLVVIVAFGVVIAALFLAIGIWDDDDFKNRAPSGTLEGLTIFAVFFVAATGIERLLEPISMLLGETKKEEAADASKTAQEKVDEAAKAPTDDKTKAAKAAADVAAAKKVVAEISKSWRKVAFWAVATVVGIAASATMKLYLLTTVGVASPSRGMEVLATGLIIGGGTQSLHALTELISAKKDAAKAAAPA